jgi:galactokinase
MAIPFTTRVSLCATQLKQHVFRSQQFAGERRVPFDQHQPSTGGWSDYPVGVLYELEKLGVKPEAFELEVDSGVPSGAGLSSSASVEVASCIAMLRHTKTKLTLQETALLCQRAENNYVGAPSGIMDQFAVLAAKKGHALLLRTRDLMYELLPMDAGYLANTCVVVCNSQVKHSVAAGQYGRRREEMEKGQTVIRTCFSGVIDLGMATLGQLEMVRSQMSYASYKRCRHVISENARVLSAKEALLLGDVTKFGSLMSEGHASQRDDLETSCEEIDILVNAAVELPGCFGSRMTGGGFGGCTVNLVETSKAESFQSQLRSTYKKATGLDAETYVFEAVDGAYRAYAQDFSSVPEESL